MLAVPGCVAYATLAFRTWYSGAAALGNQVIVIRMGANASMEKSRLRNAVFHTRKWRNAGAMGGSGPTHCQGPKWARISPGHAVSRPDKVIANALAKDMLASFELRRGLGVKRRLGLHFELKMNMLQQTRQQLRVPLPCPNAAAPKTTEEEHETGRATTGVMETPWEEVGRISEPCLDKRLE
eukprot:7734634-Pyramimonas_sp.AAC.1